MTYNTLELSELLAEKGYIRGPFGSSLLRKEMLDSGEFAVYEQSNAIKNSREFRFFIDRNKFDELKRFAVRENDLIISCSGTVGRISKIERNSYPGIISQALLILRSNEEIILPDFLKYFLQTKKGQYELLNASHGSVQVNIAPRKIVEKIPIPCPDIKTQDAICKILLAIDKKIELNQEMNETLEQIAKILFKSWFIDFDPVRAKAEGRPTGLLKEISDLFPYSFEDSELGQIPKGFKVGKLQEVAKYLNRGVSPTYVENSGVYLVNQKCIRNGQIDFSLCKQSKEKSSMNERYLEKYDILLNSMGVGTLGRVAMFHKFDKKITADALVTIIKGDSVGSSFFIYYFLERMEKYLNTISVGSTGQTSLKKEDILDLQMIIPPKKLLDEFGSQLSLHAEKKYINTQESLILTDLRDTLLPKLISGELKVPEAENLIEEASI